MRPYELYVHIPFCVRKCAYCDFTSWPCRQERIAEYMNDLILEEAQQGAVWHSRQVETIYIGGGTPSVVPAEMMDSLLLHLLSPLQLDHMTEFTSEANPGTITESWLNVMMKHGMNRLSMGMQAYQERLLQLLGRIHHHQQVVSSVKMARHAGIRRISLDLMFGLPMQTMADWTETLQHAISLEPEHISCYGLILEEGTPLWQDVQNGKLAMPEVELERDMYDAALSILKDAGYTSYELSNFSRPGEECRHNVGYWTGVPYRGLGMSASSMDWTEDHDSPCIRWNNPVSPETYHDQVLSSSSVLPNMERISRKDAMFEFFMLGLRMTRGVSLSQFRHRFGVSADSVYGKKISRLTADGWLIQTGDMLQLTRKGMDMQNSVLVEMMD